MISGVDEVGRGALAGPIVAAAVVMPAGMNIAGVKDSKKIPKKNHRLLYKRISELVFDYSFAVLSPQIIDSYGIQYANLLVLHEAVKRLSIKPDFVLSDWFSLSECQISNLAVKKGDERSMAIACASVLAKYFRDRIMASYHTGMYSQYAFNTNAGYGTEQHLKAIKNYGICNIHRKSFTRGI